MRVEFVPKGQFVNMREQAILRVVKMRGGAMRRLDLIKLLFLARENLDGDGRKTYYRSIGSGDGRDSIGAHVRRGGSGALPPLPPGSSHCGAFRTAVGR